MKFIKRKWYTKKEDETEIMSTNHLRLKFADNNSCEKSLKIPKGYSESVHVVNVYVKVNVHLWYHLFQT